MGYGLSAAIGACLGNGGRLTVAVESDGSIMLNLQELATLRGSNLPVKLIIMDNGGYASIRNTQRNYFNSRYIATGPESSLHIPDLTLIAKSFGIPAKSVHAIQDLQLELDALMSTKGPSVLVVKLNTSESLWPKVSALPQKNGTMLSMPLEDMSPLLSLEALKEEMIVPLERASIEARL